MRVTTELFVGQLVRRALADGGFAAVLRRGADMAGAVFVVERGRSGALRLFGPAPQSLADESGERRFSEEAARSETELESRFASESRFDPDFWVVEIEGVPIERFLAVVED